VLFPLRQLANNVVDEVRSGCGVEILWSHQTGPRILLLRHIRSILQVSDLGFVPRAGCRGHLSSFLSEKFKFRSRTLEPIRP
jgi:hypothetical protein